MNNSPKILHGAFVEYRPAQTASKPPSNPPPPPLTVVFQFNPVQISRSRSLSFAQPGSQFGGASEQAYPQQQGGPRAGAGGQRGGAGRERGESLRDYHLKFQDLEELRRKQQVTVQEETLSFEIRLDATDQLNDGDPFVERFGIAPQLATLELMTLPISERVKIVTAKTKAGKQQQRAFSSTAKDNPPLILFIWGEKRKLPVNINSINITESEFNTDLHPIRATVAVNLTVIEGPNSYYLYSKECIQNMSAPYVANPPEIVNISIPPITPL